MFAIKGRVKIVFRVLLCIVILLNALGSTAIVAQAKQEVDTTTGHATRSVNQESRAIRTFERPEPRMGDNTPVGTTLQKSNHAQGATALSKTANSSVIFVENVGQFDARVRFQAKTKDATIYFTDNDIWFVLLEQRIRDKKKDLFGDQSPDPFKSEEAPRKGVNLKLNFVGSKSRSQIEPSGKIETTISYFGGSEQEAQYTSVPVWKEIR